MAWTFRPPLRCKADPEMDARHGDDVMKVPRKPADIEEGDDLHDFANEVEMSVRIRALDPDQRYFLPLSDEECELDRAVIDARFGAESPTRRGYFIPYGGIPLYKAVRNATPNDAYIWLQHLLEAIQVLKAADIIHGDLHSGNIVIDPNGLLPRIIDFGAARKLKPGEVAQYDNLDVHALAMVFQHTVIYNLQQRFLNDQQLLKLESLIEMLDTKPTHSTQQMLEEMSHRIY